MIFILPSDRSCILAVLWHGTRGASLSDQLLLGTQTPQYTHVQRFYPNSTPVCFGHRMSISHHSTPRVLWSVSHPQLSFSPEAAPRLTLSGET